MGNSGIFSQSNFGIVTKMGMTLMPHPGEHESFVRPPRPVSLYQLPPFYIVLTTALLRCIHSKKNQTSRNS